jgi:hypothetical protein
MATTTDTDTELSAVNSILGSIGQSPVTTLGTSTIDNGVTAYANPEISFIYNILTEVNKDVQNEGWHFNTEYHVKESPDGNKNIVLDADVLRYDLHESEDRTKDVVVRKGKLYDLVNHTYEFTGDLYLDEVILYAFEDLPNSFQRYITYRAAVRAATQLVSNPQLVQLLTQQEAKARAVCMEYETSMGDHTYFGLPHDSNYRSYKPYSVLSR